MILTDVLVQFDLIKLVLVYLGLTRSNPTRTQPNLNRYETSST